ncbi:MAG: SDR family oxidoreductase [Chloroflexi bacterium]|nr:SDR family oxidoreductase [Chloroflexota bacterium]
MGVRLAGRVAVITGGGHGIGKAYCEGLAREGARVVVAELDGDAGERVADAIRATGADALAVRTDVSDRASVEHMCREALARFERIDILINNAAVFATIPISRVPIEEVELDEWDLVMRVNLRGLFLATRAVVPIMKKQSYGRIINISSGTVFEGVATRIHYVTSKAGVIGFTRTLAKEVGAYGITANVIAPGSTLSEDDPSPELVAMRQAHTARRAIGRVQVPNDLVGAVLFFASDEATFVTGQTLIVDGGAAMH